MKKEDKSMERSKMYEGLKRHIVDSTAILSVANPIFSALETMVIGMSNEISINAKIVGSISAFSGLGSLIAKGRDISRGLFGIDEKTSEKKQGLHDALYNAIINLAIAPLTYLASGERNFKKIAIGTAIAAGTGIVSGWPIGYSIDAFRDLTGISPSERLPNLVKKQKPRTKLGLAALITALSIGAMATIYTLNPHKYENKVEDNKPKIEQTYFLDKNS